MISEQTIRYNKRVATTQAVCARLAEEYNASICSFDRTAIAIKGMTDKQHTELCKKLHCSGHYSEKSQTGFLTNFGEYK